MMKLPQLLQHTALRYPDRLGMSYAGKDYTWSEWLERCERLAGGIKSLGMLEGERLAILSHNSNAVAELFFGPLYVGVVPVPLNWRWAIPELVACLEDCTPTALVVDEDNIENGLDLQRKCPSIKTLIYAGLGETPEGFVAYESLIEGQERISYCPYGGDDLAIIVYTGGTTGRSKGVMLTHTNFYTNSLCYLEFDKVGDDLSMLLSGPMFHVSACCRVFLHTFMATHLVVVRQFEPVEVMENIQKYGINTIVLISSMAGLILDHPRYHEFDLTSLNRLNYGAAPMPPSLIERLQTEFPDVRFFHGYGATEAAGMISMLTAEDHGYGDSGVNKRGSVGRPVSYIDIKVVNGEGKELGAGAVGEVLLRGPNIMKGYWNMPEETAKAIQNDWYHTGDAGYWDEDGYLFLVDRMKDMIISGGENIYSVEVERAIDLHPAVRQCAVVGKADEKWGETVHAVVSLRPDSELTQEELLAHCREHIAGYKCPRGLSIWEELPLSSAGKLLKKEIRDRVSEESVSA